MSNTDTTSLQEAVKRKNQLYSIFDRVEIKAHQFNPNRRSELSARVLAPDSIVWPKGQTLDETALAADLNQMLNRVHPDAHADTLPFLTQKYGWRIAHPDDKATHRDSAFCDVSRVKEALDSGSKFLLVKGDLAGIQEYIYNEIQPKRAGGLSNLAKRLRARSVMVSLLTDFVANVILRALDLGNCHLLFAGGGHFNLLLPAEKQADLDKMAPLISESLRHQFGDRMELIIAYISCDKSELEENASKCFELVNSKINALKRRPDLGNLKTLFEEKLENSKGVKDEREEFERNIGGEFPKASHLLEVYSENELKEKWGNLVLVSIPLNGYYHTLLAARGEEEAHGFLLKNKGQNIKSALVLALNNTDFLPEKDWKSDFPFVGFGFRFLGRNAPKSDNEIMDFSEIAGKNKDNSKSDGFVRLGSLMLDVDNLGVIFSHGIKNASLAQIVTLSRELNYFFTVHFDQRAQQKEYNVYVVYSGGDDAFAVGKWDNLMAFAKQLHDDFQQFICFKENTNPDVHFSAGIVMSNPHYPIGRFYEETKEAQDEAKKAEDKNRISVFGYEMSWGSYNNKYDLGNQFKDVLLKGHTNGGRKFSASFAYRIMQLVKSSYHERNVVINGEIQRRGKLRLDVFARNIARMHYLFARNGFAEEDSQKITDELEKKLMHSFLKNAMKPSESDGYKAKDYLVALNFAMLQVRSQK